MISLIYIYHLHNVYTFISSYTSFNVELKMHDNVTVNQNIQGHMTYLFMLWL